MNSRHLRLVVATAAAVSLAVVPVSGAALAAKKPKAPAVRDSDRDGMPDAYEKANGLNPRKNDARADKDRDKLPNLAEFKAGTNPSKADTDGDGLRDGDDKRPRFKDAPSKHHDEPGDDKPGRGKPSADEKPGRGKPGTDDTPGHDDEPGQDEQPGQDDEPGDDSGSLQPVVTEAL